MYGTSTFNAPGSLTLKSNAPMDYSRGVFSNKWYIKREAEPKHHELWSGDRPTLHKATYDVLAQQLPTADFNNNGISETHAAQLNMFESRSEFVEKNDKPSIVDEKNRDRVEANLANRNYLQFEYNPTVAKHKKDHNKHYFETTYNTDYKTPDPTIKTTPVQDKPIFDNSWSHRRMISQFSDPDAPKRDGINTFHIQHGVYPNQHLKQHLKQ